MNRSRWINFEKLLLNNDLSMFIKAFDHPEHHIQNEVHPQVTQLVKKLEKMEKRRLSRSEGEPFRIKMR